MKEPLAMHRTSENTIANRRNDPLGIFCQRLAGAIEELTHRLQVQYERAHPDQSELIRHVIAEAETRAWELSFFPHLFLPDLVEARIAELKLQPAFARNEATFAHAA
jgi:hypothetical protein